MFDEELLARIRAYIRTYEATFTHEALRERLIHDGAPAEAVDLVLAEMRRPPYLGPPAPGAPGTEGPARWSARRFFGVVVLCVVANLVVIAAAGGLAAWAESGTVFGVVGLVGLVAEIAAIAVYAKRNDSVTAVGLVVALCLTPVVVGVLLVGACFAILLGMGGKIGG
jgi:hypothetical protein